MSSLSRLLAYVRRVPRLYLAGGVLTVLYGMAFPMVPLAIREVILHIELGHDMDAVANSAWVLIGLGFAVAFFRFSSRYTLFRAARQIEYDIRNDLCAHLQTLPQSYFAAHRTGDLMSRATNDLNAVRLGQGLWVLIDGEAPLFWTRAVLPNPDPIPLFAGLNLVASFAPDATPVADALPSAKEKGLAFCRAVAELKKPLADVGRFFNRAGREVKYRSILLPFSDDERNVNYVIGAFSYKFS